MDDTAVTLDFADGSYKFWLPMPRIIAIEREIGYTNREGALISGSILGLFSKLGENLASLDDETFLLAGPMQVSVREAHSVILHGLIGGGDGLVNGEPVNVTETMARNLVQTYCYPVRPAIYDMGLAWQILKAAIYGVQVDAKKKDKKDADLSALAKAQS